MFVALGWDVGNTAIAAPRIESTDAEIDQLAYGLYGLSSEEIRIIEDWSALLESRHNPL